MEKKIDFYKKLVERDGNIIRLDNNEVVCKDCSIEQVGFSKKITSALFSSGIDKLSKLIYLSNSLLQYYDLESEDINEVYDLVNDFFFKNEEDEVVEELNIDEDLNYDEYFYEPETSFENNIDEMLSEDVVEEDIDDNAGGTPLEAMNLSVRSYNALLRAGYDTIEKVRLLSKEELYRIRNLGAGSIKEILQKRELEITFDSTDSFDEITSTTEIKKLNLSARSYHCLVKAGVATVGDLLSYDEFSLRKIPSMGSKSVKELLDVISKYKNVPTGTVNYIKLFFDKSNLIVEDGKVFLTERRQFILDCNILKLYLPNKLQNLLVANGCEKLSDILLLDLNSISGFGNLKRNMLYDALTEYITTEFIDLDNIVETLSKQVYNSIKTIIENTRFDGIERKSVIEQLSTTYPVDVVIEEIEHLIEEKAIFIYDNDKLFYRYESFPQFLYKMEPGDIKDIMYSRIDGATLEELGIKYEITREWIRQKQAKFIEREIEKDSIVIRYFREDRYKYLYETYMFTEEEFTEIFSEKTRTYNYLSLRYKHGNKDYHDALEDENITPRLRSCIQKYIDRDYIFVEDDAVLKRFPDILKFYFRKYCLNARRSEDIYEGVCEFVDHNAPEVSHPDSGRAFEGRLDRLPYAVMSLGKKSRYYNYDEYDFTNLLSTLDLESRNNTLVSTKYYFEKYPNLMEEYNILDNYELYYILKRLYKDKDSNLNFNRTPNIEIGTFVLEDYVRDILLDVTEISTGDLIDYIAADTGIEKPIVQSMLNDVHQYKEFGKYVLHANEELSLEQEEYLHSLINEDICFKNDVLKEFNRKYPDVNLRHLPNPLINKWGYSSNLDYIVIKPYNAGTYFYKLLTESPIVSSEIYEKYYKIGRFYNTLRDLKWERKVIEFEPYTFISLNRLSELGITKEDLDSYANECIKTANGEYFNAKFLRNQGFEHELHDLGFDDLFYENIIYFTPEIKCVSFANNMIFKATDKQFSRADVLKDIICKYRRIGSSDLLYLLKDQYAITTDLQFIRDIIAATSIYYNAIMDVFYESYQLFLEEV